MMYFTLCAVVLFSCAAVGHSAGEAKISATPKKWTNQWVMAINGTHEHAERIANKHGFTLSGKVSAGLALNGMKKQIPTQ